jgi:hypothetical protein
MFSVPGSMFVFEVRVLGSGFGVRGSGFLNLNVEHARLRAERFGVVSP